MNNWQHIRIAHGHLPSKEGQIDIFPANRIETDWLFSKFPKLKKNSSSSSNYWILETKSHVASEVLEAIWIYLEDNGWEYSSDNTFKRLQDNE